MGDLCRYRSYVVNDQRFRYCISLLPMWNSDPKFFLSFSVYVLTKMPFSCRFYKHKYPEIDDVVMVNVRSIAEMGAYVNLLEYNNIEGMILLSELSRRRIRSINKLIRVGRNECVVVIRVDKDKGLSLK